MNNIKRIIGQVLNESNNKFIQYMNKKFVGNKVRVEEMETNEEWTVRDMVFEIQRIENYDSIKFHVLITSGTMENIQYTEGPEPIDDEWWDYVPYDAMFKIIERYKKYFNVTKAITMNIEFKL